jgi:hypothetical protein
MKYTLSILVTIVIGLTLTTTNFMINQGSNNGTEFENSGFVWSGKWILDAESERISFYIDLDKKVDGTYSGHHCMIDNEAWGGSLDCANKRADGNSEQTLTEGTLINENTLEFSFKSGYTGAWGTARLIKNGDKILFRVTEKPTRFLISPLGSLVSSQDGIGQNATGGVLMKRGE